jgi:hypothetical protein
MLKLLEEIVPGKNTSFLLKIMAFSGWVILTLPSSEGTIWSV